MIACCSVVNWRPSLVAALRSALRTLRMPAITVETAGMVQDVAQRQVRQLVSVDAEVGDRRVDSLLELRWPIATEVVVAKVTVGERRTGGDAPGQATLVQRDPHDHTGALSLQA